MAGVHYDPLQKLLEDYVEEKVNELDIPTLAESFKFVSSEQVWKLITHKGG